MNINHTPDQASLDYERGMHDGYNGFTRNEFATEDYHAGYDAGNAQWHEDAQYEQNSGYDYSDVEMGMYDDDPNPYHGDYSEM